MPLEQVPTDLMKYTNNVESFREFQRSGLEVDLLHAQCRMP